MDCDFQFLAPVGEVYPAFGEALHFHQAGQRAAARAGYLALMDDPALMAVCTHQLAWLAIAEGDFARAAELLPLAIRLHPELPQFYRSLSDLARHLGDTATANRAVKDMACLLFRLGDEINGRAVAQEALALLPGDCGMLGQLAMSFVRQGERPAALAHFMAVIRLFGRIEPRLADLIAALECRLVDLDWVPLPLSGASPETVQGLEEAVSALGHLLREIGYFSEALACYRLLVEIYPELPITHFNLALALLTSGDFIEGWREYQWHWRSGQADLRYLSLPIPSWQGEPLAGCRILVWAEQGYGDVIQFGPLAQSLVRPGVQVVLGVHKPLLRLFKNSKGLWTPSTT